MTMFNEVVIRETTNLLSSVEARTIKKDKDFVLDLEKVGDYIQVTTLGYDYVRFMIPQNIIELYIYNKLNTLDKMDDVSVIAHRFYKSILEELEKEFDV